MVSGPGTTTRNDGDTLTTAEANKPPIYQALLNEMDAGTRAVVEAVGSPAEQDGDAAGASPQHRSVGDAAQAAPSSAAT